MFSRTKSNRILRIVASFAMLLTVFFLSGDVYGQSMTSSNYKLQSDSINFGGTRSGSNGYFEEDTLGEIATGMSSSTNYAVSAGFHQPTDVFISVTEADDVVMSPSLGGLTGGTSTGSTSFIVTTNNPSGYMATIKSETSPALVSAYDSFADYVPVGSDPDLIYRNASASSTFAFSPEGQDISATYKDNGWFCGTGSGDTIDACWDGLSTTPKIFLNRFSHNQPSGTVTSLKFISAIGKTRIQTDGTYVATSTVTVIPL